MYVRADETSSSLVLFGILAWNSCHLAKQGRKPEMRLMTSDHTTALDNKSTVLSISKIWPYLTKGIGLKEEELL
jgi:hypothetical protein